MPPVDVLNPQNRNPLNDPSIDPLAAALLPPANESAEERAVRLEREKIAKKNSELIDAQIERDRQELTKRRKQGDIRALLLGQSESGKSTTVKNFQIQYSPNSWKRERALWKAVIYLNLVKSVRRIITVLLEETRSAASSSSPAAGAASGGGGVGPPLSGRGPPPPGLDIHATDGGESIVTQNLTLLDTPLGSGPRGGEEDGLASSSSLLDAVRDLPGRGDGLSPEDVLPSGGGGANDGRDRAGTASSTLSTFTTALNTVVGELSPTSPLAALPVKVQNLVNRLAPPLERVERLLIRALASPDDPEDVGDEHDPTRLPRTSGEASSILGGDVGGGGLMGSSSSTSNNGNGTSGAAATPGSRANGRETAFSAVQWKKTLASTRRLSWLTGSLPNSPVSRKSTEFATPSFGGGGGGGDTSANVLSTLRSVEDDIQELWNESYVKEILQKRRFRPQDSSGFFLDDVPRLLADDYMPTDEDVLSARLKTVGVIQHEFKLDKGSEKGVHWTIYDVGGARNQRHVWASFFEDVNAIIFLAPISAFNQVLSEDPRVNRLQDSLQLFKAVCKNKLLRNVSIVLFLNKVDILRAKLESGISVNKYVISYGEQRPNDAETACKFFRNAFGAVFKENCSPDRELFIHLTTMNDPKSSAGIINNVRDMLLRRALERSSLL